jgi:hypothetical protein
LGDHFLKEFMKEVLIESPRSGISAIDIDISAFGSVEVFREWKHLDILIVDNENKLVFVIENKIGTVDHKGQLNLYKELAAKEFPNHKHVLIYLTPDGDIPSDPSASEEWRPFGYMSVEKTLERVLESTKSILGPDVLILTQHYLTMIRRHIVTEDDIPKLCRKIYKAHKDAIDLIIQHRPDKQMDMRGILIDLIKGSPAETGLDLEENRSKNYINFAILEWDKNPLQQTCNEWTKSRRMVLFEFRNSPDDLSLRLILGPGDQATRDALFNTACSKKNIFNKASGNLRKKWNQIYAKTFLKKTDLESDDMENLEIKVQKRWGEFVENDLPKINAALEWPSHNSEED